jgi:hypothetical protein
MDPKEPTSELNRYDPLIKLQGIAKELFKELGGGENFIRRERDAFLDISDRMR